MKRQFSRRRNSVGVVVWTFGAAIVVLILFVLVRVFLPGVFIAAATPFWKEGTSLDAGVGNAFIGLGNAKALAAQNAALNQQMLALQDENDVLTARAQDLTKLLGGNDVGSTQTNILAGVLAHPPESPYDTLVVAVGSSDGVVEGAQVFATGGIPIGTVQSVTAHSAIISLLSTPGRSTGGWVGESRAAVILVGASAGAFTVTLPKAAPVSVGDSVYVPGPGAIPIGTVVRVEAAAASPTEVLDIQPLVNFFSLTWVEIARTAS
jgi:cell shape-determining protein MreC